MRPDLNESQLVNYLSKQLKSLLPGTREHVFEQGLPCLVAARLIVMDMGGPNHARIWRVETDYHAYVVGNEQKGNELAFNNYLNKRRTVGYVRSNGKDNTDEYFGETWTRLGLKI